MNTLFGRERRTDSVESRLAAAMIHPSRYSGRGRKRLAADSGVPKTTLRRLLSGHSNPSFMVVCRIVAALERESGRRIDPRDIFCEGGAYPTKYVCQVMGCRGCLPPGAVDDDGRRTTKFKNVNIGQWGPEGLGDGEWLPIEEVHD